ncbi:MYND finger [Phytophthora infestans]|uniref:MYND finger n=1 Tax=Phytophthora infestans TaxID=4787 RepID=A0A833WVL1_PHYIN|nr:MYND finger [Phytophthora infestans]KAF4138402.1 MYND finger [Phytophthora infestans]
MASSVCSACQASGIKMSRCGQCKWAAYCSKTCQRDHWRTGHRQMCAKLKVCKRFRDLEREWWSTRPSDELQRFVVQFGLQPESMAFFGEVLFLLCGLKACVLLSNLPPMWRQSFANDVVLACGLLEFESSATSLYPASSIALYSVSSRLQTPAEYELTDDLVLGNTIHSDFAMAEQALRLTGATVDTTRTVQLATTDVDVSELVQEHELARMLDYPVALSDCDEDASMVEVGYFLEERQERVLLTSYCAMATLQHNQRIQQHFQRYRKCSAGLQLTLHTSQI